jgi:transcriptional coactivator HFI1/ADA1
MAALQRAETIPNLSGTPTLSSKPLPGSSSLGQKIGKPVAPTAPRIDYEPLYTALKAGIGANWHLYGESIGLYCRGMCRLTLFSCGFSVRKLQDNFLRC